LDRKRGGSRLSSIRSSPFEYLVIFHGQPAACLPPRSIGFTLEAQLARQCPASASQMLAWALKPSMVLNAQLRLCRLLQGVQPEIRHLANIPNNRFRRHFWETIILVNNYAILSHYLDFIEKKQLCSPTRKYWNLLGNSVYFLTHIVEYRILSSYCSLNPANPFAKHNVKPAVPYMLWHKHI